MKRVVSACLYQTLHFVLDPHYSKEEALEKVTEEVKKYKEQENDKMQIIEEVKYKDGTILLKVKKKVSGYPTGEYFE